MDKDNSQESMISSNSLSFGKNRGEAYYSCLLYTSDAADE
mgnify:CR=1 FL=1